jgi:hypothetical protein
MSTSAVA